MNQFELIVQLAITLEEKSIEFYQKLMERSKKPEFVKLFKDMREEEMHHKQQLDEILKKNKLPDGKKLYPDPDLKIADYVVDVDDEKENLDFQEVLIIAMKREKATLELYQNMSKQATDPAIKSLFTFLAEEEAKHKHFFEAKFDDNMLED